MTRNDRKNTSLDSENRNPEIVRGRSWYLRATAAAGICAAATPATAIITHVMVEDTWSGVVIQNNDDANSGLGTGHISLIGYHNRYVARFGNLSMWKAGVERSGTQSVGQSRSFTSYTKLTVATAHRDINPDGRLGGGAIQGDDNYIGFRVTDPDVNSGDFIYGWARLIGLDDSDITSGRIGEFAYQDDGSPIRLGQTSVVPVPEASSTLGLLVLGAAGVAGLRWRQRKENTAKACN